MDKMPKPRVLITGASGFLASHLTLQLASRELEIYGISDLLPTPETLSLFKGFEKLDIRDRASLHAHIADIKPTVIYHLAAITNVGFSWQNAALTYEVNLTGSANLIDAVNATKLPSTIVLLSSAELYGNQPGPLHEDTPLSCRSPYALSKWAMEKLVELYSYQSHLRFITIRAFNFTGPGQSPQFVASDFARQIARIELGLADALIHVGNLSALRDFSDVRDIARYLVELSVDGPNQVGTLNLCSGQAVSIQTILTQLLAMSKVQIRVETDASRLRPVDIPVLLGDPTRLREKFGLFSHYSLQQTLTDLLGYWRQIEGQG